MLAFSKNIEDPSRGISLSLKERTNSYSYEVCDMYKKVLLKAPSELHLTEKSLIEGEVQYTQLEQLAEINPLFMFSDVNENAPFGSTIEKNILGECSSRDNLTYTRYISTNTFLQDIE